jgi:D-glycero-D-manno-heptose 1,7-bisphosphate phosphatase
VTCQIDPTPGTIHVKRRAIFLDRDGTLNVDVGFTHRAQDLQLLPNVVGGLARLQALGFELLITTNQSGIARGYFTESDMHAFNDALVARLQAEGITISGIYFCPFHPTEGVGRYRRDSPLRKPQAGMLLQAAAQRGIDLAESFAIGDKTSDIMAGQAAGCRTILVRTGVGREHEAQRTARPDFVADDLLEAARFIEPFVRPPTGVPKDADSAYPPANENKGKPTRKRD